MRWGEHFPDFPNAAAAVVDKRKILDYLLSDSHPDGRGKAGYFLGLGFRKSEWRVLAEALRSVAVSNPVAGTVVSRYGTRYIVNGLMRTPTGKSAKVRTIWIQEPGFSLRVSSLRIRGRNGMMHKIREHDRVVLTTDVPVEKLKAGDVGTVIHTYAEGQAYEVEFVSLAGETLAIVTLEREQVRPIDRAELTHARRAG